MHDKLTRLPFKIMVILHNYYTALDCVIIGKSMQKASAKSIKCHDAHVIFVLLNPFIAFFTPNRLLKWAKERLDDVFSLNAPMCRYSIKLITQQSTFCDDVTPKWLSIQKCKRKTQKQNRNKFPPHNLVQPPQYLLLLDTIAASQDEQIEQIQFLPSSKYNQNTKSTLGHALHRSIQTQP